MALKLWVTLAACVVVATACTDSQDTPAPPAAALPPVARGREHRRCRQWRYAASNAGSVTNPSGGSATSKARAAAAGDELVEMTEL